MESEVSKQNIDEKEQERIRLEVEKDIFHRNNLMAELNRAYFKQKNILCVNLMSSPGSGKTSILEETIKHINGRVSVYVIEGDQETSNDADRIAALHIPSYQINTETGCHLDAEMITKAIKELEPEENSIVFIENIGNLICPAAFDLGEDKKVVIISVTEGDDKPLKYPYMFQEADLCLINKVDLLPHLNSKIDVLRGNALKVNHLLEFFDVSALKKTGIDDWCNWLIGEMEFIQ